MPRGAIEPPGRSAEPGAWAVVELSGCLGLGTGFLELMILLVWHRLDSATVLGALQMNRHFPWMVPVAHLSVFLACGLPMALAARFWSRRAARVAAIGGVGLSVFALLRIVPGLYTAAALLVGFGTARVLGPRLHAAIQRRAIRRRLRLGLAAGLSIMGGLGAYALDREVLLERRTLDGLPSADPGAPNVLLIVLDTVRADHLSVYGYERDTTPHLSRLAERGVVFDEARSAAPWTFPSHASLFTARWPHELGIAGDRPLDGLYPTLAEYLAGRGYATAGFVGNTYYCNSWYGLARGFAHYEDYYEENLLVSPTEALRSTALGRWLIRLVGTAYNVRPETVNTPKDAAKVNHDFLKWLAEYRQRERDPNRGGRLGAGAGRPFFAFLNYIDAHDPYITPPGFDRHFGLKPETLADIDTIRTWHQKRPSECTPRDIALVHDAYDDCLAYLDEQIGRLFDVLERDGTLARTLVIVTADHGEHLGEHGLHGHGKSLYSPEVHVPLIVVGSRIGLPAGRRVATPVSLRDIPATIINEIGVGLSARIPFPGLSLADYWRPAADGEAGPARPAGPILAQVAIRTQRAPQRRKNLAPAQLGPMASVLWGGKVYIRDALGGEELYDLADDPDETHNLAASPGARPSLSECRLTLDRLMGDERVSP